MADMICDKLYEFLMSILNEYTAPPPPPQLSRVVTALPATEVNKK
jgi:hypothetical protein